MPHTQENRLISIETPLGKDVLLLEGFRGGEGISMPFSFELELVSLNHNISFNEIIAKNVTISVVLEDGIARRYFNGIISRFSQGRGVATQQGDPFSYYHATMVPWFWLLTKTSDSRIFQNVSVIDIVDDVFKEKHKTMAAVLGPTPLNFVSQALASGTGKSARKDKSKLPRSSLMECRTC